MIFKQIVSLFLSWSLVLFTVQEGFAYQNPPYNSQQPQQGPPPGGQPPQGPPQAALQSPQQLQQLVAPIALYPDQLIAQILAGATYPTQIVDAQRWLNDHRNKQGEDLAKEVDKQPWDPSVKALTQFPQVLANMNQNLAWTSELGDTYVNQPQDVSAAIQFMRQQAQRAGNLQPTPQQNVVNQGSDIEIVPAQPEYVYVPQYDPWLVYGYPLAPFPGWYPWPGLYIGGPGIAFGLGFGLGFFGGFGWGWGHWGYGWNGGGVLYNHNTFISHSQSIVNRGAFRAGGSDRGGFARGGSNRGGFDRGGSERGGFDRGGGAERGSVRGNSGFSRSSGGTRTGAFSGFNHGGVARSNSFRGQSSFGGSHGGGGFHGGGGGRR